MRRCNILFCCISTFLISLISFGYCAYAEKDISEYVKKGWVMRDDLPSVITLMDECIGQFGAEADGLAEGLTAMPSEDQADAYKIMNDVAVCVFIKGEAFMRAGKDVEAISAFETVVRKYPYAQQWDPRGWYWSVKEKSIQSLQKLSTTWCDENADSCQLPEPEPVFPASDIVLNDEGTEFPVDYNKYGSFVNAGTPDYNYVIKDRTGLAEAVGAGIYPNSKSVRNDPEFQRLKKEIFELDHWKILASRDLKRAFYRWNFAAEPAHVRQFYIGDILEKAGRIKQAVKAYYACLVHYPKGYGKTYFDTPWYIAKAAIARINYLLKANPDLGYRLEGARVAIEGGFDNDIGNDVFSVDPGRFVPVDQPQQVRQPEGKIVKTIGTRVKLVQYENGDWQLQVKEKPFIVKGITYDPTRVGEAPDDGSLAEWTLQDTNSNAKADSPYDTWVDQNYNNKKEENEPVVGDFALMKRMGVNAIRRYHQPHKPEKDVLRDLYESYGIMTIMGDFLGKYTLGSNADWEKGTDYNNPEHQKNMLKSIREMVNEHKDEPYVLMWMLGNENVYGVACNADKDPDAFFKFANKAAQYIKKLDPSRPVMIASGDLLYLDIFARLCPDIDIFGTNSYRGKYGFGDFWQDVKQFSGKAAMLTEYGVSSISNGYTHEQGEAYQAEYHAGTWNDIYNNTYGRGQGNSVGGVVFEWLDEWWKAYEPDIHDERGQFIGPFLDGYIHEEWLGIVSQGDGSDSPFMRQLKKAYFVYEELWTHE